MAAVNVARNVHVQNEISNVGDLSSRESGLDCNDRCNSVSFRENRRFVGKGKVLKDGIAVLIVATRRR